MFKPELLSPAGTPGCALAAFDAGADAVYAGLNKFNARERGENFTVETMTAMVDYAHSIKRKFYLTLNTLLREQELPELLEMLAQVNQIAPDAVLVQDLGVLRIAREYFPSLTLHGSTQMGFHNSAGLELAEELGLSRVVLERQMTLEEISAVRKRTKLELEVFIHGALCCSLSGACLFSSYLGGWSGNRGKCKQPCRRRYYSREGNGFFFSPQDLSALEYLPALKNIGIESLKIEGRLKQPDYVANTVKAYRMMLDAADEDFEKALPEARNLLSKGCGRRWSAGFFTANSAKELIKSDAIGAAGQRMGNVEDIRENGFMFTTGKRLFLGDRLRVQPLSGDDGAAVTVTKMFVKNSSVRRAMPGEQVFICCDKNIPHRGIVFKIGESYPDYSKRLSALPERKTGVELDISLTARGIKVNVRNAEYPEYFYPLELKEAEKHPAGKENIFQAFAESSSSVFSLAPSSTITVDGKYFLPAAELKSARRKFWQEFSAAVTPDCVFYSDSSATALDRFHTDYITMKKVFIAPDAHLTETVAMKPNGAEPADRRAVRADDLFHINKLTDEAILPEFCPESHLASVSKAVAAAYKQGIRRFRATSLYALTLLKDYTDIFITASAPLPVCNSMAAAELSRFNVSRVMAHTEMAKDDIIALRDKSPLEVECFRLGRPALLVTRAKIPFSGTFNDARGNKFELRYEHASGLSRIFPVSVVSIPRIPGVYDFYDLRNAHWKNSECSTFNFEDSWN